MTVQSFFYGLVWNKYTQGSAIVFLSGYFVSQAGWPLTKLLGRTGWVIARTGWAWGGEVGASGYFGHQARAIGSLAKTTPGQVVVGAAVGYAIGLGTGYVISKELYGEEGADLFLDVMTPGGDVGIISKEAATEVIFPALVMQSETYIQRKADLTLQERIAEAAFEGAMGPAGMVYNFFRD